MYSGPTEKPDIKVHYAAGAVDTAVLRQLQNGMEEEGIPFDLVTVPGKSAQALAWDAANKSRLGVGVGLDDREVVLHYEKLPEERPLFRTPARSTGLGVRTLGANAARMVKKLPFKHDTP